LPAIIYYFIFASQSFGIGPVAQLDRASAF
jgi:hypothetical protein